MTAALFDTTWTFYVSGYDPVTQLLGNGLRTVIPRRIIITRFEGGVLDGRLRVVAEGRTIKRDGTKGRVLGVVLDPDAADCPAWVHDLVESVAGDAS